MLKNSEEAIHNFLLSLYAQFNEEEKLLKARSSFFFLLLFSVVVVFVFCNLTAFLLSFWRTRILALTLSASSSFLLLVFA